MRASGCRRVAARTSLAHAIASATGERGPAFPPFESKARSPPIGRILREHSVSAFLSLAAALFSRVPASHQSSNAVSHAVQVGSPLRRIRVG